MDCGARLYMLGVKRPPEFNDDALRCGLPQGCLQQLHASHMTVNTIAQGK